MTTLFISFQIKLREEFLSQSSTVTKQSKVFYWDLGKIKKSMNRMISHEMALTANWRVVRGKPIWHRWHRRHSTRTTRTQVLEIKPNISWLIRFWVPNLYTARPKSKALFRGRGLPILACITGALRAKWGERGISRKARHARDRGRRKNKVDSREDQVSSISQLDRNVHEVNVGRARTMNW